MKIYFFTILLLFSVDISGQVIKTFAGSGSPVFSGSGIPATSAGIPDPAGGFFDKYGNYFFADGQNSHRIRKIDPLGVISTVAGNGIGGFSGDSVLATGAKLNYPNAVILDTSQNIYVSDGTNNRIRKINHVTGIITTIVGDGVGAFSGDSGLAVAARI